MDTLLVQNEGYLEHKRIEPSHRRCWYSTRLVNWLTWSSDSLT